MAGVAGITCLTDREQRWLNQIRGNTYCHLFAFVVEEYIVPMVMASVAQDVNAARPGCGRSCASPRRRSSTSSSCAGPASIRKQLRGIVRADPRT